MSSHGARGRIRTDDPRFTKPFSPQAGLAHEAQGTQEATGAAKFGRPVWHPGELTLGRTCTYFFVAEGLPYFKVGRTRSLAQRRGELQTGCPVLCAFVCAFRGDSESRLHAALASFRTNGEWFEVCAESMDALVDLGLEHVAHAIWRGSEEGLSALEGGKPSPRPRLIPGGRAATALLASFRAGPVLRKAARTAGLDVLAAIAGVITIFFLA